jgi:GAF domain-containing protein
MATGQPYVTADVPADSHYGHPGAIERADDLRGKSLAVAPTAKAGACVPLLTPAGVVGVLWANREQPFGEAEARVLAAIADFAAGAVHRAALHELTEQQLKRLRALRAIDSAIMGSLDLGVTLGVLLDHTVGELEVDAAAVLLLNPATQMLEHAASRGFRTRSIQATGLRLGEGVAGRAALERHRMVVPEIAALSAEYCRAALLGAEEFQSYACAPMIAKGEVVGVLEVFCRAWCSPDAEWLSFLETLAGQAAIAAADARMFAALQRSNLEMALAYDDTLEGWARALDLRHALSPGHGQRVATLTLALAQSLRVGEAEMVPMRRGALLHDVGNLGVPERILLKAGPLTDEEWTRVRQHPVFAFELLAPLRTLRPAIDIPYCHHEKWDGTGYPRGLQGEEIPLAARIFAVVDVWDALTSDRPYRAAWPADAALGYIGAQAGRHFDPRVVEAFLVLRPDPPAGVRGAD